ncbi:hypothetical protein IEQ34_007724 [Dendrobium chrysotoxum]|uniref:H(+)-exporting diphosphatase n=1 Tax=Dendrobium chrysotoxum TaxID=161865 RepID=A0AAV7H5J7_DENCH|nr:hypothetical protein IEQ34_007724 [Dendrobium chrysotoxum]
MIVNNSILRFSGLTRQFMELFFCVAIGLWAGLVIGFVTEYYTSNAYRFIFEIEKYWTLFLLLESKVKMGPLIK